MVVFPHKEDDLAKANFKAGELSDHPCSTSQMQLLQGGVDEIMMTCGVYGVSPLMMCKDFDCDRGIFAALGRP